MLKQVIVVRNDLKLPKGKLAVQVAHASVENVLKLIKANKDLIEEWHREGMKKVVTKVSSLEELLKLYDEAIRRGFVASIIRDAGKTVVEPGTITCIAVGPHEEKALDDLTGDLKLV